MEREEVARRLLGAATQLFIDDKDPTSVHCLASSAAEHASFMAKSAGKETFNEHILSTFPEMNIKNVRKIRNRMWTAIKHSHDLRKSPINVPSELADFSDTTNDHTLFIVWYDFAHSGQPLPIGAQVFQVWYYELYPDTLSQEYVEENGHTDLFSNLLELDRIEQKRLLREQIELAITDNDLLQHLKTDSRPLLMP